jgi:hypothetical protein
VLTPDARARQEARAVEDAALLEAEGWSPAAALERARQARGLIPAPAPALYPALAAAPELPRGWRLAARDHYGSERPGTAGTTRAERYLAMKRVDLKDRKPLGRPKGSGGKPLRPSERLRGPGGES